MGVARSWCLENQRRRRIRRVGEGGSSGPKSCRLVPAHSAPRAGSACSAAAICSRIGRALGRAYVPRQVAHGGHCACAALKITDIAAEVIQLGVDPRAPGRWPAVEGKHRGLAVLRLVHGPHQIVEAPSRAGIAGRRDQQGALGGVVCAPRASCPPSGCSGPTPRRAKMSRELRSPRGLRGMCPRLYWPRISSAVVRTLPQVLGLVCSEVVAPGELGQPPQLDRSSAGGSIDSLRVLLLNAEDRIDDYILLEHRGEGFAKVRYAALGAAVRNDDHRLAPGSARNIPPVRKNRAQ